MKNKIIYIALGIFLFIISVLVIRYINIPKEGKLQEVDYNRLTQLVEKKEDFVLVVSRSTCSHCATYKPKMIEIAKKYGIDIYYIDYDNESNEKQKEFLEKFHLDGSTPITLFFKDGKEKSLFNRIEGDLSSDRVIEKMKKMGFIE